MSGEIVKPERTEMALPEGFSDLVANVAAEREEQKAYSPFVESAVKASYVLLQMGSMISAAFDRPFSDNFSVLCGQKRCRGYNVPSFAGNISLMGSGDLRIKCASPSYLLNVKPRKTRVLVSLNTGSPLDFASILYPLVYLPINSMEPDKAFAKLEKILLKGGSKHEDEINDFYKQYVSMPDILHCWLNSMAQRQQKKRKEYESAVDRLESIDEKLLR